MTRSLAEVSSYLDTRLMRQAALKLHHRAGHFVANTRLAAMVVCWRGRRPTGLGCCVVSLVVAGNGAASTMTVVADAFGMGFGCASGSASAGDRVSGRGFRDASWLLVRAAKTRHKARFAGGCGGVCGASASHGWRY